MKKLFSITSLILSALLFAGMPEAKASDKSEGAAQDPNRVITCKRGSVEVVGEPGESLAEVSRRTTVKCVVEMGEPTVPFVAPTASNFIQAKSGEFL